MTNITAVDIFESLSYVNPIYIEQADVNRLKTIQPRLSRTAKTLLIAAIIAALLVASALALQAISKPEGNSIGWFNNVMEHQEGAGLSATQKDAIAALSYSGGVTASDNGVIVTAESLTVGRYNAIVILGVTFEEGNITPTAQYSFEIYGCDLDVPDDVVIDYGFTQSFYFSDEETNKAYIVIGLDANEEIMELTRFADTFLLNFENLRCRDTESGETTSVEGHWQLPVVLSASPELETIELGNMSVRSSAQLSWPLHIQLPCRMELQNVSISGADITYSQDSKYTQAMMVFGKPVGMRYLEICAVLKNGVSISTVGGSGFTDSDGLVVFSYRWEVPFSLEDVDYIRFGSSKVFINR